MPSESPFSVGVLYEHPDWFRPLFAELEGRNAALTRLDARDLALDPDVGLPGPFDVLLNRMSPSAFLRNGASDVFATADVLHAFEAAGVPVLNGSGAWATELSKFRQVAQIRALGLRAPNTRFVRVDGVLAAADSIGYPVVVKPNVGGSGAGVARFDSRSELEAALAAGTVDLGPTSVGLVQEFIPARDGRIHRVEVLDGEVLYGIRVEAPEGEFNLCPADACRTADGRELARGACAVDAADQGLRVEAFEVEPRVAREVAAILEAGEITLGGVEFLIDDRDGGRVHYDVNALSNFVADAPVVVGFDPTSRFVDWLERHFGHGTERTRAEAALAEFGAEGGLA